MRKAFQTMAGIAAAMMLAGAADAATVTFSLTGNSATNGTHGNARSFTATNGVDTVRVRVTGWSITGGRIFDSFLGAYGSGLGVTSGDENGGSSTHVTDNQNRPDFMIFQFDQAVELVGGRFSTFSVNGAARDSDASVHYGTTGLDWMTAPDLDGENSSALDALFSGSFISLGGGSTNTRDLGTGGLVGNIWLIGAAFTNQDGRIDGFKFSNLTVNTVPGIPEPATWAMMIAGFGMAGAAIRRRRRVPVIA